LAISGQALRRRFTVIWRGILPGSSLPEELRARGYEVTATGEGERILPPAIVERFCMRGDGELEPLTPGSTRPVARIVQHAGICRVKRYAFSMP
jgi:hypothetical protein